MCLKNNIQREREQDMERRKVEALERIAARLEQLNGTIANSSLRAQLANAANHLGEKLDNIDISLQRLGNEAVNLTSVIFRQK